MPYGSQTEYLKHNTDCNCESKESCNCGCDTSDDCGCCPIGTVAVYDSCGHHISCLTPSDAAQYYVDSVDVPEGFVKVIGPDGEYIGLLTVTDYSTYLSTTVTTPTFNVTGPITITPVDGSLGEFDVVVQSGVNPYNSEISELSDVFPFAQSIDPGSSAIETLSIDRNAFFGDVVVTFASLPAGMTGNTVTIPANKSRVDATTGLPTVTWAATQTAGTYNINLVVTPAGLAPTTLTVSIVLT